MEQATQSMILKGYRGSHGSLAEEMLQSMTDSTDNPGMASAYCLHVYHPGTYEQPTDLHGLQGYNATCSMASALCPHV